MANQYQMAHDSLNRWYNKLHSRSVDLVGDYAGDEPFLIDGDSLLLHVFSDEHLDFEPGFQLLHAVFLVEKFLHELSRRKCQFHLVFFQSNELACIPEGSSKKCKAKYLLTREIVIRHLQENLEESSISVRRFRSYLDDTFRDFLRSQEIYFLMCHDGSQPLDSNPADEHEQLKPAPVIAAPVPHQPDGDDDLDSTDDEDTSADEQEPEELQLGDDAISTPKVPLRAMIHWFIKEKYNVVLINGLELRDTKVIAMVVEGSWNKVPGLHIIADLLTRSHEGSEITSVPKSEVAKLSFDSQRDLLATLVLSHMYSSGIIQKDTAYATCAQVFLLHCAALHGLDLDGQIVDISHQEPSWIDFLDEVARAGRLVLSSSSWTAIAKQDTCDLANFLNGNLFLSMAADFSKTRSYKLDGATMSHLKAMQDSVKLLCDVDISIGATLETSISRGEPSTNGTKISSKSDFSVLPFQHPVFDSHLKPVNVRVGQNKTFQSSTSHRIFEEVSHWHNHRVPIESSEAQKKMSEKDAFYARRREQRLKAEMRDYAISLTNSSTGVLDPETIIAGAGAGVGKAKGKKTSENQAETDGEPSADKNSRSAKAGKSNAARPKKQSVKETAAIVAQQRQVKAADAIFSAWNTTRSGWEAGGNPMTWYIGAKQYLSKLSQDKRAVLEGEMTCYMLSSLARLWLDQIKTRPLHIAALMWDTVNRFPKMKHGVSKDIANCVKATAVALGFPTPKLEITSQRPLSFSFTSLAVGNTQVGLSHAEFQLTQAGPYLDRNMGSAPDSRVSGFEPDKWQRDVLDQIDQGNSLFVVAPTSAGKTFISFYAMKQVLQEDDNSVLVYVAPTKALVNQIAAEIQARFSKTFKHGGKSVWGVHTRDYRINNPTGCQVLVTVPHILQIMLLAPSHANSWSRRVKRIIFDEVHCIGQADDGLIWEQLLLMAPCPIIALSATVGNPAAFSEWLQQTQTENDIPLVMIEHRHRYSDLRKFVYRPCKEFRFGGFSSPETSLKLGLDGTPGFAFMHPFASLTNSSRGIPQDLGLEPRDCWLLWQTMKAHETEKFHLDESLHPDKALPGVVRKLDVINWESRLKAVFAEWMKTPDSPFAAVVHNLEQSTINTPGRESQYSRGPAFDLVQGRSLTDGTTSFSQTILPLICSLHEQDALPALFFNYERRICENIVHTILLELQKTESLYKASSPAWRKKVAEWEAWKELEAKKAKKGPANSSKRSKNDDERQSKEDQTRDVANAEDNRWASFDPEDPVDGFHVANMKTLSKSEFADYKEELEWRGVAPWLIESLRRGVGVHHAGMNRKYRQICEMLFRKGYLRVIVATGTLALGINMPCKTVVFCGDSIFLTALNFRQAAGRAGRRGFDLLGNVVFHGIPYARICRLLTSRLPDLSGHFPITTSLVLRMNTLLHESKQSSYATRAVNAILSVPRIYLGGPESKDTVLHHLRFSIEYLRRNLLLGAKGEPLNFAGLVSHLYYAENSAFAFHALLKDGYFHALCADVDRNPSKTLLELMLVMSHLFGRQALPQFAQESFEERIKRSPSIVFLPSLPKKAADILRAHNKQTLEVFTSYVGTFIDQHVHEPDDRLPLSGMKIGSDDSHFSAAGLDGHGDRVKVTSPFVALSGHRDKWDSISDLCKSVRGGVWLEEAVIPHVGLYPDEGGMPLNAYLYDFYKHGDTVALANANGIRKGDVWFLLNDFSLVLATIVTSLTNFLELSSDGDASMIDVQGFLDTREETLDQKTNIAEDPSRWPPNAADDSIPATSTQGAAKGAVKPKSKKVVVDSWEDESSEEEETDEETDVDGTEKAANMEGWDADQNLIKVLKAFKMLHEEFGRKFKAMWA